MILSIITITKDDKEGVKRTLSSCEGWRRMPEIEQIVVAGGAENWAELTSVESARNLKLISRKPAGIADAFNAGLEIACGQWVWFLNGGDSILQELDPDWLLTLLRNSTADAVFGALKYASNGRVIPHPVPVDRWPPIASWIPHPAAIVRRKKFEQLGSFDQRYAIAMDYEYWLRLSAGDSAIDVLSVPFVLFAPGGVSQQVASRVRIRSEKGHAIRRYQFHLWSRWLRSGYRLLRVWISAWVSARI